MCNNCKPGDDISSIRSLAAVASVSVCDREEPAHT